jgi:tetratricopeptide (TPR) repeat protein
MAVNRIPYRSSLRVLGRLLNDDQACMVTITEIEHGFLLYYFRYKDRRRAVGRVVSLGEVADLDDKFRSNRSRSTDLLRNARKPGRKHQHSLPLFPMGYEDGLRAIGEGVDRRAGGAVAITELDNRLHLEYTIERGNFVLHEGHRQMLAGRRQETFGAIQIDETVRHCHAEAGAKVSKNGRLLQDNPQDVTLYIESAPILEEYGQIGEAESLYRRVLDVAPNHPEVHYHLARYARWRGNYKAAIKHLHTALSNGGGNGPTYHLLGRTLLDRQRVEVAAEALHQAVSLEPENRLYQFHLELARQRLGGGKVRRLAEVAVASAEDTTAHVLTLLQPIEIPTTVPETPAARTAGERPEQASVPSDPPEMTLDLSELPIEIQPYQSRRGGKARSRSAMYDPEAASTFEAAPDVGFGTAAEPSGESLPSIPSPDWSSSPVSWDAITPPRPLPALAQSAAEPPPVGEAADVIRRIEQRGEGANGLLQSFSQQPMGRQPASSRPAKKSAPLPNIPLEQPALPPRVEVTPPAEAQPDSVAQPISGLVERAEPITTQPREVDPVAESIARLEQMIGAEPERADLHRKLGFLLAKQGRNKDAAEAFRRAVECGRRRTG